MRNKTNAFVISLVVFVVWTAINIGTALFFAGGGSESIGETVARGVNPSFVLAVAFLLVAIFALGWRREVGLQPGESARNLKILWLPALYIVGYFVAALVTGLSVTTATAFFIVNTILIGTSEELMFRGVSFYGALTRFNVWAAIIITSFLFGAVHVLNGFVTGDFTGAIVQAVSAGLSGLWFIAIRVRTKSIYPGIVIHCLYDCTLFLLGSAGAPANEPAAPDAAPTILSAFLPILLELPLIIYGFWLLRGVGNKSKEEILGLDENPTAVEERPATV